MMRLLRFAAVACVALLSFGELQARQKPVVAAASSLSSALKEIAAAFAKSGGPQVELVFGASGALTRQILDGAPFEAFLAADEDFPRQLAAAGLTRDAGKVYAVGRVALFAPTGSPLTVDSRLEGLSKLVKAGGVTRFAIANPAVAPYGEAAEAVLRKHGLLDALRPRLVLGDNIAQAAQFATTGNAVGGIIAYSIVLAPEFGNRGTYAVLPDGDHPPLRQAMVLLKRASPATERFYQFVQGPEARAILQKHGFAVPQ